MGRFEAVGAAPEPDAAPAPWLVPGPLLAGRRAVVTGGAAGIGAAITRAFAAHGAHVLVLDPGPVPDAPRPVEHLRLDVLDAAVPGRVAGFRPDVLVNNVGHFVRPPTPFADDDPRHWSALAEINLDHAVRLTHAALPGMSERGGGSIVNLTTVEAHRAIPGHAMYSAYKAALSQFTRSLAVEVGRQRIRVNAIAPDLIETPQVPYASLVPPEDRDGWPLWAPLGGPGRPDDVAGTALFLASDLARYVTGTTVHVDGGTYAAGGWFPRADGNGWTNRPRHP